MVAQADPSPGGIVTLADIAIHLALIVLVVAGSAARRPVGRPEGPSPLVR